MNNVSLSSGCDPIMFGNDERSETLPPHQNPITLEADIARYRVKKILVNTDAQPDILFRHAFRIMSQKIQSSLLSCSMSVYSPNNQLIPVLSIVTLSMCISEFVDEDEAQSIVGKVTFKVVKSHNPYNIILGMHTRSLFDLHLRPKTMDVQLLTPEAPIIIYTRPLCDEALLATKVNRLEQLNRYLTP